MFVNVDALICIISFVRIIMCWYLVLVGKLVTQLLKYTLVKWVKMSRVDYKLSAYSLLLAVM